MIIDALLVVAMQSTPELVRYRGARYYYKRVRKPRRVVAPPTMVHTLICDDDCEVPEPKRVRTICIGHCSTFLDKWNELPADWQVIVRVSR